MATLQQDGLLVSATALTGTQTGSWMQLDADGRTHCALSVILSAGTATIAIYGRIGSGDTRVKLKEVTASEGLMIASFPQMQVEVTGATTATVRVTIDGVLRVV